LSGETYHFRVIAINASGTTYGGNMTFTTGGTAPAVTTNTSSGVTTTGATLNGTVNANNQSTTVTFEYGTTIAYGASISAVPATVSGISDTSVTASLTGLIANTTYHYRVIGQNASGTTNGADMIFTTGGGGPSVITNTPSGITTNGAIFNGTINANSLSTTVTLNME